MSHKSSIERLRELLRRVGCGLLLFSPGAVWAADWYVDADAELATEFNDNPILSREPDKSVWGRRLDVDMLLAAETALTELRLQPQLTVSRYSGSEDLDNDVAQVTIGTRRHWERTSTALSLDWRRDTTLTSELEDTGFIQTTKPRTLRSAHPSIVYAWSERLDTSFHWDYTDVSYQDALFTGLTDYTHQSLGGAVVFKASSRDRLQAELYGTRFKAPRINNQVTDLGLQTKYRHDWHEYTQVAVTVGMHRVTSELALTGVGYRSEKNGFIGDIALNKNDETTSWRVSMQRTVDPSGSGLLVQNDRFAIDASFHFSPYWTANLNGVYMQNAALQSQLAFDSRRYGRVSAKAIRRLSPNWRLSLQYTYQWHKYLSASQNAEANQVIANISYDMDKRHLYP